MSARDSCGCAASDMAAICSSISDTRVGRDKDDDGETGDCGVGDGGTGTEAVAGVVAGVEAVLDTDAFVGGIYRGTEIPLAFPRGTS